MYTFEELRAILLEHDQNKSRLEDLRSGIFYIDFKEKGGSKQMEPGTTQAFDAADQWMVVLDFNQEGKVTGIEIA